jgi:c-di-GMP-binding flagellar brake protein YcgR
MAWKKRTPAPSRARRERSVAETRRIHKRYRCVRRVQILLPSKDIVQADTYDVSEGGLSVSCARSLPAGAICQIGYTQWDAEGSRTFAAEAVVRHVVFANNGGFRIGLQFSALPESSRLMLSKLLRRLAVEHAANFSGSEVSKDTVRAEALLGG